MPVFRGVLSLMVGALLAGCLLACSSSSQTPPATAEDGPVESNPKPEHTSAPAGTVDEGPASLNTTDHEMTHRDCQALGERYRDLVVSDEMVKLDPKLTSDQREKGHDAILHGAEQLSGPWIDRCGETLVGKFASEEALRCAVSAKTVSAFDVCLNGPPVPPAGHPSAPPKK